MPKVLIAPSTLANIQASFIQVLRDAGLELVYPNTQHQLSEEELLEHLRGIDASLAGSEPYTRRVLAAHPQLRVIARAGVGYDAVDVAAATELGVAVTFTPGTNHDAVAEHTFTHILALAKGLIGQHLAVKAGGWPRGATIPLRGRTLGIVGLGRIGKAVAVRGAAFGMKMIAFEPYPDRDFAQKYNITLMPMEKVLAEGDFVSIHVPLGPETKYLINKKTLALMKPTAFLINESRGGLVCEADLLVALREKRIAGAGLDVYEQEPPGSSPLFALDNVVLTPHAAGVDLQSRDDMAHSAAQSIATILKGGWTAETVVNPDVRSRLRR